MQPLYGGYRAAYQRPVYLGDSGAMASQLYPESVSKVSRRSGRLVLCCLVLFASTPAVLAHQTLPPTPSVAWTTWNWHLWIVGSLSLTAWLYLRGTRVLRHTLARERGGHRWHAVAFWSGWCALGMALVSPLHALGAVLFSAHMVQHEVLMLIAAPLLVLSRPLPLLLWALPLP